MSSLDNSMSHKGEKKGNYTTEFKRGAIEYAEKNSNYKAAKKFRVAVKRKTTRLTIRKPISLMDF